jgi:vacuolar iron transporter family protein
MIRKFPRSLQHEHSPRAIHLRLSRQRSASSIRDFIYGALDGIITTFAIVAGVKGAELSQVTIIILGLSNIVADGFSMAASNYLGTKAELDERELLANYEAGQIDANPTGEEEEIRQIYLTKGFSGERLDSMVKLVISDRQQWINTMLAEEYQLPGGIRSPLRAAVVTFLAFLVFGLIPLTPYLFNWSGDFLLTSIMTAVAFILLGALKSRWSLEAPWISATKTLLLGSIAAALAYGVGSLLRNW